MKTRRVIVTFEIETDASIAELKNATMYTCGSHSQSRSISYMEANRVNIVRSSTAKRGKVKEKTK